MTYGTDPNKPQPNKSVVDYTSDFVAAFEEMYGVGAKATGDKTLIDPKKFKCRGTVISMAKAGFIVRNIPMTPVGRLKIFTITKAGADHINRHLPS